MTLLKRLVCAVLGHRPGDIVWVIVKPNYLTYRGAEIISADVTAVRVGRKCRRCREVVE